MPWSLRTDLRSRKFPSTVESTAFSFGLQEGGTLGLSLETADP